MGSNGSRVLEIDNLNDRFDECIVKGQFQCPVYGSVKYVEFKKMDFFLGVSEHENIPIPHKMSLHYLVRPNYLLYPTFTLLQNIELSSFIEGVSEMIIQGGHVGIGYGRIGYNARWGIVGEKDIYWPYQQISEGVNFSGIYLSPQLMISLSKREQYPEVDYEKCDVFAFGIMIIELIFKETLDEIYDYQNFQIYLNPLLQKISHIKENFGEDFHKILIAMLEIEEEERIDFSDLLENVDYLLNQYAQQQQSSGMLGSSSHSQKGAHYSRGHNRTPSKTGSSTYSNQQRSPRAQQQQQISAYRNDVSPFRGRFGSNVRPSRTPERQSKSPLKRDMKINTRFDKENAGGMVNSRQAFTDFNGTKVVPQRNLSPMMRR